ncbi:MAG: hypothetical protein A3F10_01505 [Coxiella sp. RIFCSPHIGHO2_12_FULL_42_15]|nr:MAG: hypothetical protein A3F10_01505 [Coxiella sp. RIFCSPHIGHO2_12_FULL_42_15]
MFTALRQPRQYLPVFFCVGLALFYLYESLLRVMPSVIGEEIRQAYQLSFLSFGAICASYYLLYVPLQLVAGVLVDRYHLMYLMIVALLLCAGGCCLFANAYSFWLATLGRMMMGVGAAFVFVTILKAICVRLPLRHFTFYLGIIICVGMLGGWMMDCALIFFMKAWGWRLMCYLLATLGIIFVIWHSSFRHPSSKKHRENHPTFSLKHDFFQLKEYLLNTTLLIQCIIGALLYLPIVGFAESWGIGFLKQTRYFSQEIAALQMSLLFLGFAIGAPIVGWVYDRTGLHQLILTMGAVGVTILLSIVLYVPDLSVADLSVFLSLLGFFSSSLVVVLSLTRQMVPKQHVGKVFGIVNFIMLLASSVTWLIGWLMHLLMMSPMNHYQLAFIILPCGSLGAVILSYFVRE